jgi:Kef-type K+ transport system membrane component KefB
MGAVLGWVFERSIYSTFIGYLLGGLLVSLLFVNLGVDVSTLFSEVSFLSNLGVVIFFFEMGLFVNIESISKSLNKILVVELFSYPLLWVAARVISSILGFSIVEETLIAMLFTAYYLTAFGISKNVDVRVKKVEDVYEILKAFICGRGPCPAPLDMLFSMDY